jgi:hypothetical protein
MLHCGTCSTFTRSEVVFMNRPSPLHPGWRSRPRSSKPRRRLALESLEDRINPAPPLLSSFDGIDINGAGGAVPPDPNAAAGPTEVISVVNNAIDVRDKTGNLIFQQDDASFFGSVYQGTTISDPKVLYDQYANRFVIVDLALNFGAGSNDPANLGQIMMAVSTSDTPTDGSTTSWNFGSVNDKTFITGNDYWLDYPGFGLDSKALYITGNMFPFGFGGENGTRLFIVHKALFYNNDVVSAKEYDPAKLAGLPIPSSSSTLQPAHIYGATPGSVGTWLVTWVNPAGNTPNKLGLIRVDSPLTTPKFTYQSLSTGNIGGGFSPPSAPSFQGDTIDVLDGRVQDAVWRNGNLYATATVTPPSEIPHRSAVHWFRIDTTDLTTPAIADQGDITGDDLGPFTYTYDGSVAVDSTGNMAIGFSASNSSTLSPGAYYTVHLATDPPGTVEPSGTLMAGQGPYGDGSGGPDRWGDYSGAAVDPTDDKTFWIFNEYASSDLTDPWITHYGSFIVPNKAPVLIGANSLNSILENQPLATNPGTLVTDLISGQASDTDNDPLGIALTAVDSTHGTWQYTLDGTNYLNITGVTNAHALLLNGDGIAAVRFLPNVDFTGTASIKFRAWDGADNLTEGSFTDTTTNGDPTAYSSAAQPTSITVVLINHAPVFNLPPGNPPNVAVLEDAGSQTVLGFATGIAPGPPTDPDEANQALDFRISYTTTGNLAFTAGHAPAIDPATGNLTFTTATETFGTATVTVKLHDNGGTANGGVDTSAAQTFTITVTGVNDPPSFTLPNPAVVSVLEDAGAQSVSGFASNIQAGPAGDPFETGQTVNFQITAVTINPGDNLAFSAGPAIDSSGKLTFTTATETFGTATVTVQAKDTGGTLNGGADTSAPQTFTITVTGVNDPPSFTFNSNLVPVTVLEDAGAQSFNNFAQNIAAGPPGDPFEANQAVSFQITAVTIHPGDNLAFSAGPAIDSSGKLTFTTATETFGTATVTVQAKDTGGTLNGGVDTSAPQTFTIMVTGVNDQPSFNLPADPPPVPDAAGLQTIAGFATNIANGPPGDPFEANQQLHFNVNLTNSTGDLAFTTFPGIDTSGTLTYAGVTGSFGTATFSVTLQDDGGTANGGVDTSVAQIFTITVLPANDPPSFNLSGDPPTVLEDAGLQTVNGFATNIAAGPAGDPFEVGQQVNFLVSLPTVTSGNLAFSVPPSIDPSGNLTYTTATETFGTATFTVKLHDDGGTANGGVDTSAAQTFTITVTGVNDPPTITLPASAPTVLEDAGPQSVAGFASNISAGPTGDPFEAGQHLTVQVSTTTTSGNLALSNGPTIDLATGNLTYTTATETFGTATVTVNLMDDGGTANGGVDTTTKTFTIAVTGVNDPPTITLPASAPTVLEDAGLQTVAGFASNIAAGPRDDPFEANQTLTFHVTTTVTGGDLTFITPPTIDPTTGNLTYLTGHNAYGTATVSVTLQDTGGTANGGQDSAGPQAFTLTVVAVADTPTLTVANTTGNEGDILPLTIHAGLTDNAEILSVKLSGLPAGATLSAGVNQGNGVYTFTPAQLANLTITDPNPGTFTMTVTATSTEPSNGDSASRSAPLVFTNNVVPPVVHIGGGPIFDPGVDYTLQLSASDVGTLSVHQWTINWGDGTVQTVFGNPTQVQHQFPVLEQTYTISATATDNNGTYPTNRVTATAHLTSASERYVARAHFDLFGTTIDQTHLWLYSGALDLGTLTRTSVISDMLQSAPSGYQAHLVNTVYLQLRGRLPTANELNQGLGMLDGAIRVGARTSRLAALEAKVLGSPGALSSRAGQQALIARLFQQFTQQMPRPSFLRGLFNRRGRPAATPQVLIGIFASDAYFAKASL